MAKPELVAYLQTNMKKYPVDALRKQLAADGVSTADFDAALQEALRTPLPRRLAPKKHLAGAIFLIGGVIIVLVFALISLSRQPPPGAELEPKQRLMEGAFVGEAGYIVKLPEGYAAIAGTKGGLGKIEIVHFAKKETDPTNFVNEGLYGQLGIVRLEVRRHRLAGTFDGMERLTAMIEAQAIRREEKYAKKSLQISVLRGVEFTFEVPFPRIETYILGEQHLYLFTAGQVDEIYKEIVYSLRDPSAGG